MLPFNTSFFKDIVGMSEIPLNKFEKRELILRLLKEGKIYREIFLQYYQYPHQSVLL